MGNHKLILDVKTNVFRGPFGVKLKFFWELCPLLYLVQGMLLGNTILYVKAVVLRIVYSKQSAKNKPCIPIYSKNMLTVFFYA